MSYELRLPPDTQAEITDYLRARTASLEEQAEATEAILAELRKLEVNPRLGAPHFGGPFESRRIHRFRIDLQGVTRDLQVVYKVHEADRIVVVSGFSPVQL